MILEPFLDNIHALSPERQSNETSKNFSGSVEHEKLALISDKGGGVGDHQVLARARAIPFHAKVERRSGFSFPVVLSFETKCTSAAVTNSLLIL